MSSVTHTIPIHFFKVILSRNLEDKELMIPRDFVKKYWKKISNPVVLMVSNGAEWKLEWANRNGDIWFEEGWERFAKFYSLRHGSFVVFKYEGGSLFHVLVFGVNALEINYDGEGTSKHYQGIEESLEILSESERPTLRKRKKSNEELDDTQQKVSGDGRRGLSKATKKELLEDINGRRRALERAKKFQAEITENPSFVRPLTPYYVQKDSLMVPSQFSRQYLNGLEGTASIGVGEDRSWSVRFKFSNSRKQTTLSTGWKSFSQEYNLEGGDACVFEMTESTPTAVSFKIYIFRAREEPSSEQSQGYEHEANQLHNNEWGNFCNGEFGEGKSREGISRRSCPKSDVLEISDSSNMNKFKVAIQENHLKGSNPIIPNNFMKRNRRWHGKYVVLQVGEQLHRVKMIYYRYKCAFGKFSAGWSRFARECKLKAGDICWFEMTDEENLVFKVSISSHHH